MENRKILRAAFLLVFLLLPQAVAAYEPRSTHAALAAEAVRLFNAASSDALIEPQDTEAIVRGSIDEDEGARPLHHFFDPIRQTGLILTPSAASEFGLPILSFSSSKDWAMATKDQAGADSILLGTVMPYFSAGTDFSWPRAIYDYTWGNRSRGLAALGHILHLVADATVPDHTRNDPHPPFADAIFHQSSPYEKWTGRFSQSNIEEEGKINTGVLRPLNLASLDEYFINTAVYSNNNFFSKDTIQDSAYKKPAIAREIKKTLTNGLIYNFGLDAKGMHLAVIAKTLDKTSGEIIKSYSLIDPDSLVLRDYWMHLSQKAVENSAGVIGLFLREVEEEKTSRRLYDLNQSWLEKAAKAVVGFTKGISRKITGLAAAIGMSADEPKAQPKDPTEVFNLTALELKPAAKPKEPLIKKTPAGPNETSKLKLAESKIPKKEIDSPKAKPPPTESWPPPLGRFIRGGGPPPSPAEIAKTSTEAKTSSSATTSSVTTLQSTETASTTATTTLSATATSTPATSTPSFFEEISPGDYDSGLISPNVSLTISGCESAATSTCFIAATSTAISWSSTSTDWDRFDLDCRYESATCPGFPMTSRATTTLEFTGTTSVIYAFSVSAVDYSGSRSPTTTKIFEFVSASASTTELASTTESSIITDSASTTESEITTESASTTETSTATTTTPTAAPAPTDAADDTAASTAVEGDTVSDEEPSSTDALDSPSADIDSGDKIEGPTAAELVASSTAPQ